MKEQRLYFIKVLSYLFTFFIFIFGTYFYFKRISAPIQNDFWVYFRTSERIHTGSSQAIYDLKDGSLPFRYPPPALIFFQPLSLLEQSTSREVWFFFQIFCYVLGYFSLYRCLKELRTKQCVFITCVAFLSTVRYYFDSLMSGQVSGVIFALLSSGLLMCIRSQFVGASILLIIPVLFKIGPGILSFLILSFSKFKIRLILKIAVIVSLLSFLSSLLFKDSPHFNLWVNWFSVVSNDGNYYNSAIEKSQALRSVLLRLMGSSKVTEQIWFCMMSIVSLFIILLWAFRKPTSKEGTVWSYCSGVLAFMLLMPQSLPYQLVYQSIPVLFLLRQLTVVEKNKTLSYLLVCFALFSSIPGSDVVGYQIANVIQKYSLPFIVMSWMFAYCILQFYRHSENKLVS